MTNPETGEHVCVGCSREWKGSLYCPECQKHQVGATQPSLGALAARASLFSTVEKVLQHCCKCHKPNSVTQVGYFCQECMHAMSYNSYLRRYTD